MSNPSVTTWAGSNIPTGISVPRAPMDGWRVKPPRNLWSGERTTAPTTATGDINWAELSRRAQSTDAAAQDSSTGKLAAARAALRRVGHYLPTARAKAIEKVLADADRRPLWQKGW